MRYNRTRHKALLILSKKFNKLLNEKTGSIGGNEIGLSNEELNSLLNIDDRKRRLVFSELFKNEEVMPYHLDGISGCFIHSEKGLESIANERYLEIRDDTKRNKEMQQIEQKVEELKGNIKSMELKHNNYKTNDSISNELE